jgi:hypothetical protein
MSNLEDLATVAVLFESVSFEAIREGYNEKVRKINYTTINCFLDISH